MRKNQKKSTVHRLLYSAGIEENDVRYACGFTAPDPFYLLMVGSKPHLLVSGLEAARAARQCPSAIIYTPASLARRPSERLGMDECLIRLLKKLRIRRIETAPSFPVGTARTLEQAGICLDISDRPPFPQRACKNEKEIAYITRSQQAAAAAIRRAVDCIQQADMSSAGWLMDGSKKLTSEKLKALIEEELQKRNCTGCGTIVAIGPQGARPHDEGSGPIKAGQPIVMDVFPHDKTTGYWGDMTRTVVRGMASPELLHMYKTVLAVQTRVLAMLKPGVSGNAIQRRVEEWFAAAGYETKPSPPGYESGFIHSVGHGVGLDIHEMPGLRKGAGKLRAGNVITVEPGLYYPDIGGIRIEDTVVITADGCRILAPCSKKFILP